ncbi:Glycosyltransferase, catalytic subunit of cellulose synthase and poly-beta-1,6-N-acetylglucosamine synthase [Neorhodopirellula lusitana]|uniref:Glycosyltransferase, catalytic subunit of cellulose synthase and poly-beta-1,6-N-acetylglucosamine synthase n=1 Tax=Neorhodopirellula lusitana TaxID=445327 RepID=A0ABY1QNP3_9BACT|nr:glycosyltransferase family 2 protein [Neorhodopirellula lusitana]SMP76398.1 Glycosyltransferase, catalytic subunit of cellulose synthase and poly-beta-1,6-N-acetylglucosamine synthase [Neorhodopirellula lusitana]
MLNDWNHWLSSLQTDQWLFALLPLLLFDGLRYSLGSLAIWLYDFAREVGITLLGNRKEPRFGYCPSVCVVIAGLNEAETLPHTLRSVWNSYPQLEIIVVDDGSRDAMSRVATDFARDHAGVTVLKKNNRGGKSSALNFALPFTTAEILVGVDSDSHVGENAIWEIVQPFANAEVGAVSAAVVARNTHASLVSRLQALEYLGSIFLGRLLSDRFGTLGIVSGAFGAFRRDALSRTGGWDVGPGEDGDLTLRIRKSGYQVAFAPYAQCFTNVPTAAMSLIKQRRRWEWALITLECRKHVDLANPLSKNFCINNLTMLMDRWTFNLALQFGFWAYMGWLCVHANNDTWKLFFLYYLVFVAMNVIQIAVVLYYSNDRRRDLSAGFAIPLMPLYQVALRAVMFYGILEELFFRSSHHDNFVPEHVRRTTWHW